MIAEVIFMRLPQFKEFLVSEEMKKKYNIDDGLCDDEKEAIKEYKDGKGGFFVPFFENDYEKNMIVVISGDKQATLVGVMKGIESLISCKECFDENEGVIKVTTHYIKEVDKEGIKELMKIYFPKSFDKFVW